MNEKDKLAQFLRDVVAEVKADPKPMGCYRFTLDGNYAVYVGWLSGYDPEDKYLVHANDEPEWCLCAGVKLRNDWDWSDFGFLCSPTDEEGYLLAEDVSLNADEDFDGMAESLLADYRNVLEYDERKAEEEDMTADELAYVRYLRGEYAYDDYVAVCDHEGCEPLPPKEAE